MTVIDFLWVFTCGGYFGWIVRRVVENQRRRHLAEAARLWLCRSCLWTGQQAEAYHHSTETLHTTVNADPFASRPSRTSTTKPEEG